MDCILICNHWNEFRVIALFLLLLSLLPHEYFLLFLSFPTFWIIFTPIFLLKMWLYSVIDCICFWLIRTISILIGTWKRRKESRSEEEEEEMNSRADHISNFLIRFNSNYSHALSLHLSLQLLFHLPLLVSHFMHQKMFLKTKEGDFFVKNYISKYGWMWSLSFAHQQQKSVSKESSWILFKKVIWFLLNAFNCLLFLVNFRSRLITRQLSHCVIIFPN